MKSKFTQYCTGCGLCKAIGRSEIQKDERGFFHPVEEQNLHDLCPASGLQCSSFDKTNVWGRNHGVFIGWTNDRLLRQKASSGGITTQAACYLLENNYVDCVIHVGADEKDPTKTKLIYSRTAEEVKVHCGSRYSVSSPLLEVDKLDLQKKYAFIGKPCDVIALRNYMDILPELRKSILYVFSFFCMGVPSEKAQAKLLSELGCKNCKSLTYRGNGWPGFTTSEDADGKTAKMDYNSSWGRILGRDLMTACKYCVDGIGEMADISCGDAWYLTENQKPDFREHDGRNVIFARTEIGFQLLSEMKRKGVISMEEYGNYKQELPLIQTSQYNRRRQMLARILALRVLLEPAPNYPLSLLRSYASGMSFGDFFKTFAGTCKRIWKEKT